MNDKTTVEQELLAATGQKVKGKKESDQDFLVRVSAAVSELGDPEYEALSEQAQAWFTQAAAALNEEPAAPENIQAFEEFDEAAEEVEGDATDDEKESAAEEEVEEEPASKKKVAVVKPAKKEPAPVEAKVTASDKGKKAKVVAAATKPVAAKEKPASRGVSVADTIRYVMCEDPEITKEGVDKALKAKKLSFDPSRLDQVYSATARVLAILAELKKLK